MNAKKAIVFALMATIMLAGCHGGKKPQVHEISKKKNLDFSGNYITDDYLKKDQGYDWVAILVNRTGDSTYHISARSRIDRKQPTCTFDAEAVIQDSNRLAASIEGKTIIITLKDSLLQIAAEKPEEDGLLCYYCSGGATVAGIYKKYNEPLDTTQIDRRIFTKFLNLQNISFDISTLRIGSNQQLTVQPIGLSKDHQKYVTLIDGSVEDAEIEDLNADGFPEVLIYTVTADGIYGNVIGYSVNKGKSLSQIGFSNLKDSPQANQGFRGHDKFRIVETNLVQRFRVYLPNDTNEKPTGNLRQIQYKLKEGEACRVFAIDKIVEFPAQ